MQKKGLSDVVTTVLLILAALAAVAIIWNVMRPFLANSGIDVQQFSSQLSVPESGVAVDQNDNLAYVRVDRQGGDGDIVGFIVGLQDPQGLVKTFRQNMTINQLEARNLVVNYTDAAFEDVISVTVTPIFRNNVTGNEIIGQPITQTVKNKTTYKLPTNGLVAHWKFDESWTDSVGSANANQFIGSNPNYPAFDINNKKKGIASADFIGTSDSYVYSSTAPNPSTFTLVAFVYPRDLSLNPVNNVLVKGTGSDGYYLRFNRGASQWEFGTNGQTRASFTGNPTSQQWEFLAATYDNSAQILTLYYNSQVSSVSNIPYDPSTNSLNVGSRFKGNIDEVMIFNRVLSSQEIGDIRTKYKGN